MKFATRCRAPIGNGGREMEVSASGILNRARKGFRREVRGLVTVHGPQETGGADFSCGVSGNALPSPFEDLGGDEVRKSRVAWKALDAVR